MRKLLLLPAIIFILFGCQNAKEVENVEKKEKEIPALSEKKAEEAFQNIEGDWSWNLPDTDSTLNISNQSKDSFDFSLNVMSGGHVGEISGGAEVTGNEATYSIELEDPIFPESGSACTLSFTINEDHINVKESSNCIAFHGMAVSFEGDYYKKTQESPKEPEVSKEQQSEIFTVKDNQYYINGITLGDDKNKVIKLLGNPQSEGIDESGFSDVILEYDQFSVSITQDVVTSLYIITDKNTFEGALTKENSENKYVNEASEIIYFYSNETEQVIFGKVDNGAFNVFLDYADGNFKFGLEQGHIVQANAI